LDTEERKLFHDRIRALDRRIIPGVTKLNWLADKHSLDLYHKEARKHCRSLGASVSDFKAALVRIEELCKGISTNLLINVEKKKLYEYSDFEAVQAAHHARVSYASA
jgi:dynein heavy chain